MGFRPERGDCYRIPLDGTTRDLTFVKKLPGGWLVFVDNITGKPHALDDQKLAKMLSEKVAVKVESSSWLDRIDIHALMDASTPNTPIETQRKIHAAQQKVAEAAMLLFYVSRYDQACKHSSKPSYSKHIEDNYAAAVRAGHFHKPSSSALQRAVKKGIPHARRLADYLSKRGEHSKRQWKDPWVHEKLQEMVELYYSEGNPHPPQLQEVVTRFLGAAILENRARLARGEKELKYPKSTALETHVRREETKERLERRDPTKALEKYGVRGEGATADYPLQQVQVDQTEIDEWIDIYDEDGNVEDTKRPWLVSIIDVYSRMILAAVLTFDKPSTYTVQLAIKQMLRPKQFLIDRFGPKKGATDGYGQPDGMSFDNGSENVGFSMRALLGDAGIDMDVAPVAVPQAKAIVERGFRTYNQGIWHNAPGGIPYKPHLLSARRLKPKEKAQWALDFATGVMWHWIVNVYHYRTKNELGACPARLWVEKVVDPMVGRAVSARLDIVDILCGQRRRLFIDGSGVLYDTYVFHHPKITEEFLLATVPLEKRSKQGRRGKVSVEAIIYPHDCSFITIVDTVRNRFVRLPNEKPIFADGLSYAEAARIRATNRHLERQFISEEELILAKCAYFKLIDDARALERAERAIRQAKKAQKRAAHDDPVIWTLVDGDYIETGTIEPTVRGDAPYDIPQQPAAMERASTLIAHKDQQRGARKGRETREVNKQIEMLRNAAKAGASEPISQTRGRPSQAIPVIADPQRFLDELADDLD